MDSGDVTIQNLEGPFNYHLYIGFAPANKNLVLKLRAGLQKHGVICFLRFPSDSDKDSILEAVNTSQKCLLFVTSDYVKDDWYEFETSAVIEKSKLFFHDMVIILKSDNLDVIPERLRKFPPHDFKPENLNDEKFMAQFVDMITREPKANLTFAAKKITGCESACNYFYGFLRYVLSDFTDRLVNMLKNDPDLVPKAIKKMLIIMPESCICPTELKVKDLIEFTGKYIVRVAHRSGNDKRDFKSSLYKLIDAEKQDEYYFAGEFATPLLTMYEAYSDGLCGMTKDDLYAGRDGFYFTLKAILSHPNNTKCNNQFKLLYWSDPETKKTNQLNLYDFLLPVLREEISLEQQNERNPCKIEATSNVRLSMPNQPLLNTFKTVPFDGCNPAGIYEMVAKYPMDHRLRGLCLIINIINFDKGHNDLEPRTGAEKDEELLEKLFKDLHFEVQVHKDINAQTLELLFLTMQDADHTNYDAFVCCIMTHGKLGVIYTSDGKEVEILKLVDLLTEQRCPSLKGKPKMFFIQACQRGDHEQDYGAAVSSLPLDGSVEGHVAFPLSQIAASSCAANMELIPLYSRESAEYVQEGISSILNGISNIVEVEPEIKEDAFADPISSPPDENFPMAMSHKAVLVPGSPDFLMSYSTLPGSVSYRDTQTGSYYIQALNDCLRKDMEIDRALKMVTSSVKEKLIKREKLDGVKERFQLPFHLTSAMERLIYL